MAGKARVHELAKEFGVPSKNVLEALKEMGEFVKSASSTVEAPVVRRLEETKGPEWKAAAEAKAARAAKAAAKKAAKTAEPADVSADAEVATADPRSGRARPARSRRTASRRPTAALPRPRHGRRAGRAGHRCPASSAGGHAAGDRDAGCPGGLRRGAGGTSRPR